MRIHDLRFRVVAVCVRLLLARSSRLRFTTSPTASALRELRYLGGEGRGYCVGSSDSSDSPASSSGNVPALSRTPKIRRVRLVRKVRGPREEVPDRVPELGGYCA